MRSDSDSMVTAKDDGSQCLPSQQLAHLVCTFKRSLGKDSRQINSPGEVVADLVAGLQTG